jgi:hypothetical protein
MASLSAFTAWPGLTSDSGPGSSSKQDGSTGTQASSNSTQAGGGGAASSSVRLDRVLLTLSPLPEGLSTPGARAAGPGPGPGPHPPPAGAGGGVKTGPGWSQWATSMGVSLEELGVTAASQAGGYS